MNSSNIKDNRKRGSVAKFLEEKMIENSKLCIVTAYFTVYAFDALKDKLGSLKQVEFLFGEPAFIKTVKPENAESKVYKIENDQIQLASKLTQKNIAKECAMWIKEKVKIKSIKQSGLLHGKMYHITTPQEQEDAILGSSNFTMKGLGLAQNSNIELNLEIDSKRDVVELKKWFYEIWNDSNLVTDVKSEVLKHLELLYKNNSPQIVYFKTLYHLFENFLNEESSLKDLENQKQFTETMIWKKLYQFQKDGVKTAINKINKYNGCIIADSVGLGKTFEALAVIKYFEQYGNQNVLVICPKKLRKNWTKYQVQNNDRTNPFLGDKFRYTVLSHTDLSRETGWVDSINLENFYWENYDLIVIDESHNFRNNTKGRKDEYGEVKKSRYERLLDDVITKGINTKVLLLSATPVNNTLDDLQNQLYFITAGKDGAFKENLEILNLKSLISQSKREFLEWSKQENKTQMTLLDKLNPSFFKLLDALTIARSRKHIKNHYPESLKEIGAFPKRKKPQSIYSKIDLLDEFPHYDDINDTILNYKLSLFTPAVFLKEKHKKEYAEQSKIAQFTQESREKFLIGMMKSNFLKRLESSVYSFKITLGNTIQKIDNLIGKIDKFEKYDFDDFVFEDYEDNELNEMLRVGKKLKYDLKDIDLDDWKYALNKDRNELEKLYRKALKITPERDAKLNELKNLISEKIKNPTLDKFNKGNRKVVVFTAFSDTAKYIYDNIKDYIKNDLNVNIALVTGSDSNTTLGKNDYDEILINFSPISKERANHNILEEIDILIATDCISEGQNLQDCDYLINYDIHWNPVRLIQRFGRIDRIGSIHNEIQLVNFWPTDDLNKYIKLKNRVEERMTLVDVSATNADNILSPDEIEEVIKSDLKYRDKQLKRMKDEILDLEDFEEGISLTDFTLEDFRLELISFIQTNKELLEKMPLGINGVTSREILSLSGDKHNLSQGVIFCLKQLNKPKDKENINPLQPYFLVYITMEGVIKYTFVNTKKILEIYRALCSNRTELDESLYELFDEQTSNGQDMELFNDLLNKALRKIKEKFEHKMYDNLFNVRGGKIPKFNELINSNEDFELITWLVII
ncbi:MAG: helicase-related protein [Candidatus Gastranaerophilales bacterium]|nr:helicase-related protein [Candidatus Gastranaerophilales bacterium]